MKVVARNILVTLIFLIVVASVVPGWTAWSQTVAADGPYFVVDPRIPAAQETLHVFSTIPRAIDRLQRLGPQAWGATLILLPGAYPVGATININIPYLKIVTRDGTDKARLVATAAIGTGNPLLRVTARGVTVQDVKLIGNAINPPTPGITGIVVGAPDVTVQGVLISAFSGNGLTANNSEKLSIIGCSVINNAGNGIRLNGCEDAVINNCDITRNRAPGVNITNSNNAEITGCKVSNNVGNGIGITGSSFVKITKNKEVNANVATGVFITGCGYCEISENGLVGNAAGITLTRSVGCTVQGNTCQNTGGPAISLINGTGNHIIKNTLYGVDTPVPATATILLSGAAVQNTISENTITSNWWGIVLTQQGGSPSGNVISDNKIANTSAAGIFVNRSGGNNVIQKNSVSSSANFGIQINFANSDRFDSNSIENSAADGISITGAAAGAVTNCFLTNNLIANPGGNGIAINAGPLGSITALTLSHNIINKAAANGLVVAGPATFSAELNEITANEGTGVNINGAAGMVLRRNTIHNNEQVGLQIAALAGPAFVRQNSIYANQRGGVHYNPNNQPFVLEGNSIFSNLGYALSIGKGALAGGTSFAKNWWGSSTGPSGVLNGTGNAVLGLPNARLIAPILSAPPFMGLASDTKPFLMVDEAQVAFIPTFTAGRVVVDRTDTAALKLVFTHVSVRNNALVATVPFTADALSSKVFTALGKVIAASCILVSGIQDGNVSVSFEYPTGLKAKSSQLTLYVYQGGNWKLTGSGNWSLENGEWVLVSNCHLDTAHNIVGDIPVEALTGGVKAIVLLEKQAQP